MAIAPFLQIFLCNMKSNLLSFSAFALMIAALASCEDIYEGGDKDLPAIAVQIKAQIIPYENDRPEAAGADIKLGVYMISSETNTPMASNLEMSTDADGIVDTGDHLYYPQDGTKVNIMCYAPYTASATADNLLALDVSTPEAAAASDFLYAANRNKYMALAPIKVQLKHLLSRVEFDVTAGEGVTDDDLVDVAFAFDAMSINADFNLITSELTSKAEGRIPVTVHDNGHSGLSYVMPGAVPNLVVACTFKGLKFTKKLGPIEFLSGKVYKFDIVMTEPGFDIVLRQIEDWQVVEY